MYFLLNIHISFDSFLSLLLSLRKLDIYNKYMLRMILVFHFFSTLIKTIHLLFTPPPKKSLVHASRRIHPGAGCDWSGQSHVVCRPIRRFFALRRFFCKLFIDRRRDKGRALMEDTDGFFADEENLQEPV